MVLTAGTVSTKTTDSVLAADHTYSLSDMFLYYPIMNIKPNLIAQAKQLMNSPK